MEVGFAHALPATCAEIVSTAVPAVCAVFIAQHNSYLKVWVQSFADHAAVEKIFALGRSLCSCCFSSFLLSTAATSRPGAAPAPESQRAAASRVCQGRVARGGWVR